MQYPSRGLCMPCRYSDGMIAIVDKSYCLFKLTRKNVRISEILGGFSSTEDVSYQQWNPHYNPKTVWRPSQVYNGKPYTKIQYAPELDFFTNHIIHLFHIPQCSIQNRNVHISVLNGALWHMEQMHSGICEVSQLCTSFALCHILLWSGAGWVVHIC